MNFDFIRVTFFKSNKKSVSSAYRKSVDSVKLELCDEQIKEIQEAFDLFDADRSGKIDTRQLKVALEALGFDPLWDELRLLMQAHGSKKKGSKFYFNYNSYIQFLPKQFRLLRF